MDGEALPRHRQSHFTICLRPTLIVTNDFGATARSQRPPDGLLDPLLDGSDRSIHHCDVDKARVVATGNYSCIG